MLDHEGYPDPTAKSGIPHRDSVGIPKGFRGIPHGFAGIPWDSAWVETMSFHTSGASGISPIIILEASMVEILGCESLCLALSSSVYKALICPLYLLF